MTKRPLSITIISWIFILFGGLTFLINLRPLADSAALQRIADFPYEFWLSPVIQILALLSGVFMLYGFNWARWLLVLWVGHHVIISFRHSVWDLTVHSLLFAVVLYITFRPQATEYFRSARVKFPPTVSMILMAFLLSIPAIAQQTSTNIDWPDGKRAALSLSFDDARQSQVDTGLALLDKHKVKATFYVVPGAVERKLDGWKKVVGSGHEIGNHSLNHPCTGNFAWSRQKALEDYTTEKMRDELAQANRRIKELLGVSAESFAYPCGQTFVGRGVDTRSYVPVVATLFSSGRTWQDETANDPGFCDLAQATGIEMDGRDFEQILPILDKARETGQWVVLAGHDIGQGGSQTTRVAMLEKLMIYANDPANKLWLAPVGTIAKYIREKRITKSTKITK
jgi:peptidoglycan/xylan/chitin deacetylase (PgdA/CDA1 family)